MIAGNQAAIKKLRAAARALRELPRKMGEFYANGGPGVAYGVVNDRFGGEGNARFAPLSTQYALWKQGQSKALNKKQKENWGRGSKLINVAFNTRHQGVDVGGTAKGSMPILVLTGKLRAITSSMRSHPITVQGDTAVVTFKGLPDYAKYLRSGTKYMPARSPVDPNEEDLMRVQEFAMRWLSGQMGEGQSSTVFGEGVARTTT